MFAKKSLSFLSTVTL